jgi:hypothetical protein
MKTGKVIDDCLGGVPFIDEIYSLGPSQEGNSDAYSKECINTICESLSIHKGNLMVIIAGYENEVNDCFFGANQGLLSRFIWRFNIGGYDATELMQIFCHKILENGWSYEKTITSQWFENKMDTFKGYGRDMEMLFSYTKICHSSRVFGNLSVTVKYLTCIDIENGYNLYLKNNGSGKREKEISFGLYV